MDLENHYLEIPKDLGLKIHTEFRKVRRKNLNGLGAKTFLERFVKPSAKSSGFDEDELANYGLSYVFGRKSFNHFRGRRNLFYSDTFYRIMLTHREWPISFSSFQFVKNPEEAILIGQIQGIKGAEASLSPLRWPNALVNFVLDLARESNIPEVWILPWEKNQWNNNEVKGNPIMYYDITAKREGFDYDEKMEVYRKNVDS
ncbi:hypothetical protein HY449_00535 [Candidatus Pacearchaeota archaeon]|nr:hypothetical protein [Candidatus Pacearchaeota archaeon]